MKKTHLFLLLLAAVIITPSCTDDDGSGDPVSIARAVYMFSGNANDGTANGFNGTVYGATLTTDRFGNPNKAYNFTNLVTAQYIELPTYAAILGTSEEISISFWCKFSGTDRGPTPITTYPDNANDRMAVSVPYHPSASPADIYWDHGNIFTSGRLTTKVYADTDWHHYVCIKSAASNIMEIYRDNALFTSKIGYSNLSNKNRNIRIGGSDVVGFFVGAIDDVKIYDKRLSAAEVTKLYNNEVL